jgi:hypothetical protein
VTEEVVAAPAPRRKRVPKNPVTPADREIFWQHVLAWQVTLGLDSWRFHLSDKRPPRSAAADVECFHPDRMAKFRLGDDLGATKVTSENLEALAFHEVNHVLLAPLVDQEASGLEDDALLAAEHQIIHTLQKLFTQGRF